MTRIASGVTDQGFYFVAADATDLKARETGLSSFTVVRSRNGAADVTMTTPTIIEIDASTMPGVYWLLCDEDTTLDSGDDEQEMSYHITHAGMHPVTKVITLFRPKITAGTTLSVESDGDLTKVNTLDGHTAQTGDAYARLGAPAGASVSADIVALKTQTGAIETDTQDIQDRLPAALVGGRMDSNVQAMATGVVSAAALAADAANEVADAWLDRADGVETGITPRQLLRAIGAALAGLVSGAATTEVTIKAINNSGTTRITATVDADGNRSDVTLDL